MSTPRSQARARQVTGMLRALRRGDKDAADHLLGLVYDQLRAMARSKLARAGPGQTLQATALVHEAWLRCTRDGGADWDSRAHFFGSAARAMRDIMVDQARRKSSQKRSHGRRVDIEPDRLGLTAPSRAADILAVHEALRELERDDPRQGKIVELRFFAGLTMAEIAEALDSSLSTVERQWRFARSWLQKELADRTAEPAGGSDDP